MELTVTSKKILLFFRLLSKTGVFCPELKAATKPLPLSAPSEVGAFPCPAPKPAAATGERRSPPTRGSAGEGWRELEAALEDVEMSKEK